MHARRGPSLRFTVGHARSVHWNQGCRLCPGGGRRVGRQVEAGAWASAVEDGHAHERDARAAVDNGQDESERRVQRVLHHGGVGVVQRHSSRTRDEFTLCA